MFLIKLSKAPVAGVAGGAGFQPVGVRDAARRMAELRCRPFDLESLTTFRDDWFDEPRG